MYLLTLLGMVGDCNSLGTFSWIHAALLGIVEGATEFLPVSSSAHLILINHFLGLTKQDAVFQEGLTHFCVVIQLGAILAACFVFSNYMKILYQGIYSRLPEGVALWRSLICAFVPTGILGFFLERWIESSLRGPFVLAITLALGAFLMFLAQFYFKNQKSKVDICSLSIGACIFIGFMQSLALCPGISRSMMTIVAGLCVGLGWIQAVEFSFLLGLMTIGVASLYKIQKMILAQSCLMNIFSWDTIIIGFVLAFIVAMIVSRWFLWFLPRYGLNLFAFYRLIVSFLFLLIIFY